MSQSLLVLVGGIVLSQAHYQAHYQSPYHGHYQAHPHPQGYNRLSRGYTLSSSPLPSHTRSFSQSPRKSLLRSSRRRLTVMGDRFPSQAERCGNCAGVPVAQVCGSDGKTYRSDTAQLSNLMLTTFYTGTPASCS